MGFHMKDATAMLAKKKAAQKSDKASMPAHEMVSLDRRYGQIGISAVAAAVRYQGDAKNAAYAPVPAKWDERAGEAA